MSDEQIGKICDLFDDIEESIGNVPPKLANIDESVPEHIRKENKTIYVTQTIQL